jgi:hypothetical protein
LWLGRRYLIELYSIQEIIFKLEEEGNPALLLLLPKLLAETTVSGSAAGLGCWLVVETVQPTDSALRIAEMFLCSKVMGWYPL